MDILSTIALVPDNLGTGQRVKSDDSAVVSSYRAVYGSTDILYSKNAVNVLGFIFAPSL